MNWLYIRFQTFKCKKIFKSLFYVFFLMENWLGKFKNGWENLLLEGVAQWRLQRKP